MFIKSIQDNQNAKEDLVSMLTEETIKHTERIWSLRFLKQFSGIVVIGLSAASVLTNTVLNGTLSAEVVFTMHILVVCIVFILLWRQSQRYEVRLACIAGLLWGCASIITNILLFIPSVETLFIIHTLNLLAGVCLFSALGAISLIVIPLRHKGRITFTILMAGIPLAAILAFILTLHNEPPYTDHPEFIFLYESLLVVDCATIIFWCARPALWKYLCIPTLLIGIGVGIQLLLILPFIGDIGIHVFY